MKVIFLGFSKISYMPYLNFYLDTLSNRTDIEFDLIYWDRDGKPDTAVPKEIKNAFKFEAYLEEELPLMKKLPFFARYRAFSLGVLKRKHYDMIVLLHTTPGLTVLDYLARHYKGRYILDFRDISHEYISLYRHLVGILANNSALTYVSSNAYRKYLPDLDRIYTIHNYLNDSLNQRGIRSSVSRKQDTIKLSYWGLVRHREVNVKLIDAIGNDSRFELHYYGRMQQVGRDLQEYVEEKKYMNIFFHGQYMPSERYTFAKETDMIHNLYNCDRVTTDAMGNKYYDGIIFCIPQLCADGSYMGETVTKHKVGLALNMNESDISDKLWDYYTNINWETFVHNCDIAIDEVIKEQELAKKKLIEFFG